MDYAGRKKKAKNNNSNNSKPQLTLIFLKRSEKILLLENGNRIIYQIFKG